MFLQRYCRTKQGKKHSYYALVESVRTEAPAHASMSSPIWANSSVTRNAVGNGPSPFTAVRGVPSNCNCFPMTTKCRSPIIPTSFVFVSIGSGWSQWSAFQRCLAGALVMALCRSGPDRRSSCAAGQRDRGTRRCRGHQGHQPSVPTMQRVRLGRRLEWQHGPRGSARRTDNLELGQIQLGEIELETTSGQKLALRRVAPARTLNKNASWTR